MKTKKIAMGLLVAATPLLLAGCGNKKTITCEAEEDGTKTTIELKYDNKKGEFLSAKMSEEYIYADMDEDLAEYVEEYIEDACDDMDEDAGYKNCKVKTSKKGATLTVEMDVDDLNDRYEDTDLDDIIEELEDSADIECKVK